MLAIMLKTNLMRDPVGCLNSGGLSYSTGLNILVGYLYSGGLSLFCWAVYLVSYLYFSGPSVFWWANFILLGCFI